MKLLVMMSLFISCNCFATGFGAILPTPEKSNFVTASAGAMVSSVGILGDIDVGITHYPLITSAFSASGRMIYGSNTAAGLLNLTFQPIAAYPTQQGFLFGIIVSGQAGYGILKSFASGLVGGSASLRLCTHVTPLCVDVGEELFTRVGERGGYTSTTLNLVWMQ